MEKINTSIGSGNMKHINKYNDFLLEKINFKATLKQLKNNVSKKTIKVIVISLLAIYSVTQIKSMLSNETEITPNNLQEIYSVLDNPTHKNTTHKNTTSKKVTTLKLSQEGWDFIRKEEQLRLKAYKIGDGMISIGYGHAEPIKRYKYKMGDEISLETATKLFYKDVNYAANGVKRMLKEWREQGLNADLNQHQYDAIVSMTYNMGVSNMRRSNFISLLKKVFSSKKGADLLGISSSTHMFDQKLKNAADSIKTCNVEDKFPGLVKRRLGEYNLFNKTNI